MLARAQLDTIVTIVPMHASLPNLQTCLSGATDSHSRRRVSLGRQLDTQISLVFRFRGKTAAVGPTIAGARLLSFVSLSPDWHPFDCYLSRDGRMYVHVGAPKKMSATGTAREAPDLNGSSDLLLGRQELYGNGEVHEGLFPSEMCNLCS